MSVRFIDPSRVMLAVLSVVCVLIVLASVLVFSGRVVIMH
jgi:hypothetical protein